MIEIESVILIDNFVNIYESVRLERYYYVFSHD